MIRIRPVTVLVAVLVTLPLVSCGSGDDASRASNTTATTGTDAATSTTGDEAGGARGTGDGEPVPSQGCAPGAPPAAAVTDERRTLTSAGVERWYLLTVPEPASPPVPVPLVVDFHGLMEGAEIHSTMTGFSDLAVAEGFVVAMPHGTGQVPKWAAGPGGDASEPNEDVDFVGALLDEIEGHACIDTSRVYATGLSNGAMMTSLLACRMADRFAAVAPVAGAHVFENCEPAEPMPVLAIHGTVDPILRFNGGIGDLDGLMSGVAEAPTSTAVADLHGDGYPRHVADWAARNGCDADPTDERVTEHVVRRTFDCPDGADVEFHVVEGGGHSWPSSEFSRSIERIVGPTTFEIDATEMAWEFFQRFRRA